MKANLISAVIFFAASICGYSQVWQQTASTPEGSGVTDMLIRQSNQHIFVTTGSFNWPNGDMGGVRRSTDDGGTWENVSDDVFVARTIIDAPDGNLYTSIWPFPQAEGLYRSTDNGINWAPVTNGIPGNSWVRDVEVDSGGYVVAATTN